ncbi:hypothetical protein EVJ58_g674 [Rhodofomes roseus]|uniref:BZIP domain-containing protein n=1 Tax=Rhodofomes roseus TaxID=34475 RepID=A0A4Y9Z377_9APHY|nr:hypothetical protein EVJ58_g674 [Rhodofomes roseus]
MLTKKPEDRQQSAADALPDVDNGAAVQALMEVLQGELDVDVAFATSLTMSGVGVFSASPEFQAVADFNDFLTSPMESPWDDFLTTPVVGTDNVGSDMFTSPAIVDDDDFDGFGGPSLFGGSIGLTGAATPSTPGQPLRQGGPTGTRKNVTPDSLVPLDAPIQPRKYVLPSSTSRKEVPAVFARKRARSSAFGDEDELCADDLPQHDLDAIEAKRRQNTLAARRSRKRKLEHQRGLEMTVEQERTEKEMWKARATMFEALLRSHGLEVPLINP